MSTVSGVSTQSQDLKLDFLNLLVTQLRNQNPLEPMDNAEMTSQLAQISQLEQLEGLNSTFAEAMAMAEGRYAASLIGKQVTFIPPDVGVACRGLVSGAELVDGKFQLAVGNYYVALSDILGITD